MEWKFLIWRSLWDEIPWFYQNHGIGFAKGETFLIKEFNQKIVSVVWDCDPTPHISPKEHQKERCGHYSVAALLHYVLWCTSEYFVVGRISCYVSYDNIGTNVCQWPFAENFLSPISLLNRVHQQFRISFDDVNATSILIVIASSSKLHSCYTL